MSRKADKNLEILILCIIFGTKSNTLSFVIMSTTTLKTVTSFELQARIDEVMQEHDKGNYVRCSNKQELQVLLDSL